MTYAEAPLAVAPTFALAVLVLAANPSASALLSASWCVSGEGNESGNIVFSESVDNCRAAGRASAAGLRGCDRAEVGEVIGLVERGELEMGAVEARMLFTCCAPVGALLGDVSGVPYKLGVGEVFILAERGVAGTLFAALRLLPLPTAAERGRG